MTNQKVIEVLEEFCPGEDVANAEGLIDNRILDSITVVALVAELEDVFEITIPAVEIVADNFNSAIALTAMIDRLIEDQLG